jgi:two-component system nitrogen regulation response regulator GlnG
LATPLAARLGRGTSRYTSGVSADPRDSSGEPSPTGLDAETRDISASWQPLGEVRVPGLTLLHHPDLGRVGDRIALTALAAGHEAALSRLEPYFSRPGVPGARPLADPYLSRTPLRIVPREDGGITLKGEAKARVRIDGAIFAGQLEIDKAAMGRGW